jgi:hypothetical protein
VSRVSILGLVGALVVALLWLALRGETARSGSSADSTAPIATLDTPARAKLLPPATAEEVAASSMAPEERSTDRVDASKILPTISGRVVVPGGIPAQEHASVAAEVYVGRVNQRGNTRQISTPVADDGSFSLTVPEDTRYALLDVEATALELPEGVRALPGESEVILRPNVLAWVEGRVIPPAGTTLSAESAWLEIVVRCGPASVHPTENTAQDRNPFLGIHPDEQGRFEIPFLPIGVPLSLRVEHPFGRSQELELDPLLVGERREVLVTLDRGVTVAGRVLDEHGRAVEGVSVSAHLHRSGLSFTQQSSDDPKTDGEGRFILAKLQRAALEIAAYGEDLLEPAIVLVDGTAGDALGLEVHVTRGACIDGTVVWPDGTPTESFEVGALGSHGPVAVVHERPVPPARSRGRALRPGGECYSRIAAGYFIGSWRSCRQREPRTRPRDEDRHRGEWDGGRRQGRARAELLRLGGTAILRVGSEPLEGEHGQQWALLPRWPDSR